MWGIITVGTFILTIICIVVALFLAFYHVKVSDTDKITTMQQFNIPADKALDEYEATLKKIESNLAKIYITTVGSTKFKQAEQRAYIKKLSGVDKAVYDLDDKSHVLKKYIYAPIGVGVISAMVFLYACKVIYGIK